MLKYNIANYLQGRTLLRVVQLVCGLSIMFYGYDQGVMSGVNTAADYVKLMKIGTVAPNGKVTITNPSRQGGIVTIYYLGTLFGGLVGGWISDRIGRTRAVLVGTAWGILGASLSASAQNIPWMCCGRVINGIGTGHLNAVVPVWSSETALHSGRGGYLSLEFTLNILGVVIAYWLEFGLSYIDNGRSAIIWRLPIAFQIWMLMLLAILIVFMPESPRWLTKMGRYDEAHFILKRLRGEARALLELNEIKAAIELEEEQKSMNSYLFLLFGIGDKTNFHIARRVQMVFWLQIMQQWVGIAAVTLYAPKIFTLAGYSQHKAQWLSGLNNVIYMFATLFAVHFMDKLGRRKILFYGCTAQGISLFLGAAMTVLQIDQPHRRAEYGAAAVFFVFLFNAIFGASWLTVPWLYPSEIFPLQVRAQCFSFAVVGWSVGNGWLHLLNPVILSRIGDKVLFINAACNFLFIPIIYVFYPETNQRTLEELDLLFATKAPFVWEYEKEFERLKLEHAELAAVTMKEQSTEHVETLAKGTAEKAQGEAV